MAVQQGKPDLSLLSRTNVPRELDLGQDFEPVLQTDIDRTVHVVQLARGFALAGLPWLLLLLGLGTMDPLTRAVYPVGTQTDASQ
jgi:hypothetical protein